MTKGGKLIDGIFVGETINTPSMLCVEDYLDALNWAKSVGGLKGLMARADANFKVLADWAAKTPWIDFFAEDPATRSNTSVTASRSSIPTSPRSTSPGRKPSSAPSPRGSTRRASPTTSPSIAMRRRTSASGPARRSRRPTSPRSPTWLDWGYARRESRAQDLPPITRCRPSEAVRPTCRPRVLVSDKLSKTAVQIFKDRGVEVDYLPDLGKDKEKLAAVIGDYDGLAIRSATKVTAKLLGAATKLRVIGRAGIGVDNVDVPAASQRGIIVMNTPFGNSITTAEHAIAMMFAVARQLPAADASTQAGKWEKNRFMGVEITAKTLGVIGCGNIGSIVAERAIGLKMKVIAFDPFLSEERAMQLGVDKVELDELFRRADFITLHTPLTEKTKNIIDAAAIAKMKDGVRIINCARGGLVVEEDLAAAIKSGKVAGAGVDVFVDRAGGSERRCSACPTSSARRISARRRPRRRRTSPSRSPSRCPTI